MPNWSYLEQRKTTDFSRSDLGIGFNFSEIVPTINSTIEAFLKFEHVHQSPDEINKINALWEEYDFNLRNVLSFLVPEGELMANSKKKRDTLCETIKNQSLDIKQILGGIYALTDEAQSAVSALSSQLLTKIQETEQYSNKIHADNDVWVAQKNNELNTLASSLRSLHSELENFTIEKVATRHGEIFKNQARWNMVSSFIWFTIFILTGSAFSFYIMVYFFPLLEKLENGIVAGNILPSGLNSFVVLFIITRGSIAILFASLMYVAIKNFNVTTNLSYINRHRENSLKSSEIIVKLAGFDKELRSRIIEKIADTIYSQQQTGQISEGKKVSMNEVLSIVKLAKE